MGVDVEFDWTGKVVFKSSRFDFFECNIYRIKGNFFTQVNLRCYELSLRSLRDLITPNLKILFVGTSPGELSSKSGHYFAGPSNVFWKLLFESKLTPTRLTAVEDASILKYKMGLTDIIKKPTKTPKEIKENCSMKNTQRLNRAINLFNPKIVAFVGKNSFRIYSQNQAKLEYGFQYNFNDVRMYLLPSTSGQSYADTKYAEKLEMFRELRRYSLRL
ncbi:MAG: mismatch-specific DNA-glycosylase [Nitrosarchaeum sp.]|nr:mismatch-specific DNA-glycosylase [Nitrosarchaeum sp.]